MQWTAGGAEFFLAFQLLAVVRLNRPGTVVKPKNILTVFILVLCHWALWAQLDASVATPPRVLFTGVLTSAEDRNRKGLLEDFEVIIGKQTRMFLLDEMETVGNVGVNRAILQRLIPRLLRIAGPEEVIRRLTSDDLLGKVVTLEGLLYTGSRTLYVIELRFNAN